MLGDDFKMKKTVREVVREAIEPTVTELGYSIWDITYSKIGADYHLEITIDSENGINIDDCEKVHRAIDPIIDECDPIEDFYYLDVSSPGIERELRTEEHINLSIGERVEAKLFAQKDGRKSIIGTLSAFQDGKITITEGENAIVLTQSEVSKLQTIYFED
jgi:ribosome maturation factor RimP